MGGSPATGVKIIGSNGQISLGKQFAGRQVLVEEQEPGVWLIRTATVVPDNERWLHEAKPARDLQTALVWVRANPLDDRDLTNSATTAGLATGESERN